jgi:hypothetical protein
MKTTVLVALLFVLPTAFVLGQTAGSFLDSPDAYLGRTPPVDAAVRFNLPVGPGAKAIERIAISSDGREIFYTEYANGNPVIKRVAFAAGKWSTPASLFPDYMGPSLSPDGHTLYAEDGLKYCWYSSRKAGSWTEPVRLFSQTFKQHYLIMTTSGNLYVASTPVVGSRADVSQVVGNKTDATVQSLGAPLNSQDNGFDFFMSRDESYAIVVILNKGYGAGDLCVSFKKPDGSWTRPADLGPTINSSDWEYGPSTSPDDRYIFFTRENEGAVYWARLDTLLGEMRKKLGITK